ncbi:MAG: hypothetical protein GX665_05170 [Gammaproteobacteria bacterium]|nr:hypothetical protein [Gammaproteobacteria bacterium]
MSKAADLTDSVIAALGATGLPVYPHADVVPDGAPMPCILLNIESDEMLDAVGYKAKRQRAYSLTTVFRRGATERELNEAAKGVMTALGFGLAPQQRPVPGMHTAEQLMEYEFAGKGSNHTTVTQIVYFNYIETYQ